MADAISRWLDSIEMAKRKKKFEAISATTLTGKPTLEQLMMNGMVA